MTKQEYKWFQRLSIYKIGPGKGALADLLELAHLLEQLQADIPDPLPYNHQDPDARGGVKWIPLSV